MRVPLPELSPTDFCAPPHRSSIFEDLRPSRHSIIGQAQTSIFELSIFDLRRACPTDVKN
jgi:hypothetical protein